MHCNGWESKEDDKNAQGTKVRVINDRGSDSDDKKARAAKLMLYQ